MKLYKNKRFFVEQNNKRYEFESGAEVYIFDLGCFNGVPEERIFKYVSFVHDLYLKDQNYTPLGKLADYVAENWEKIQDKTRYDILSDFYISLN